MTGQLARPVVDGTIVHDDAFHPMAYAGTCLRCRRSELAPGCEPRNHGDRLRALADRGVCAYVLELLRSTRSPKDLRDVESLTDAQIAEMNAVAARRLAASQP